MPDRDRPAISVPAAVLAALLLVALVSGLTLGQGRQRLLALAVAAAGAGRLELRRRVRRAARARRPPEDGRGRAAPAVHGGSGG